MRGQFGRPSPTPFALFDRESSSWKTSSLSLALANLPAPALIWPKQGMWGRGGAFELLTSGRLTSGIDSSSSPLLPTPDAGVFNDGQSIQAFQERRERELAKGYNGNGGGLALAMMVRLLPTPRQSDGIRGQQDTKRADRPGAGGQTIAEVTHRLLPTPMARSGDQSQRGLSATSAAKRMADGRRMLDDAVALLPTPTVGDSKTARNATASRSPGSKHHSGTTLTDRLLPTPAARDHKGESVRNRRTINGRQTTPGAGQMPNAVAALLPTPKASDGAKGGPNMRGSKGDLSMPSAVTRIGQSTDTRSSGGQSSSDEPPPLRLF